MFGNYEEKKRKLYKAMNGYGTFMAIAEDMHEVLVHEMCGERCKYHDEMSKAYEIGFDEDPKLPKPCKNCPIFKII